jgi:hypothetical protein
LTEIDLSSHSPCLSITVGEVTVKEEEGSLLPSLERLEASVEEDKTVATLHLKSLVLATDNTTVVVFLKNQVGTHCFSLYSLCREILLLCSELQIQLVVRHIPGHLNVEETTTLRPNFPLDKLPNPDWKHLCRELG